MKSIILCEGYTDCILLQYFLRKAYGWKDGGRDLILEKKFKPMRVLKKTNDILKIGGCKGCTELLSKLSFVLDMNNISADDGAEFERIVLITDRDEQNTEQNFISGIMNVLSDNHVRVKGLSNNQWCDGTYINGRGKELQMKLLLLDSVAADDPYDAGMISKCNLFVDHIDPQKRYLHQRRHVTKAKFNVYFSVRAAEEQFVERQSVLMSVKWEQYSGIQKDFRKLGALSEDGQEIC